MAPARKPIQERFWPKVERRGDDECWPWTAGTNGVGYGLLTAGGRSTKKVYAHRLAYELLVGPIPEGLQLDHLCRVPSCVNPAHLEPVTQKENMNRGVGMGAKWKGQTHCLHGHPFDEENTYMWRGIRHCSTCRRASALRSYHRKREGAS